MVSLKNFSLEDLRFLKTDIEENTYKTMAYDVYTRRLKIIDKIEKVIKEKESPTIYTFTNIKTGESFSLYD